MPEQRISIVGVIGGEVFGAAARRRAANARFTTDVAS